MKTKWSQQDMANAVRAVREDKVPLLRAATIFKVPRNTLRYRIENDIPLEDLKFVQRGPITALCRSDEESLANFIVYLDKHGFLLNKHVINEFALSMAKKEGTHVKFNKGAGPGKQWWAGFRQRHPEVKLWKPRRSHPRTQAIVSMKNKLKRHFKTLKTILDENNVRDRKRLIFNCGESGVEVDLPSRSTRSLRGASVVETKEHISVQLCVTASGEALPPMIIFSGKRPPKGKCIQGGPDGTLYGSSKSGFLNAELYLLWFKNIFLKYVTFRPVVLIQEGNVCHLTPEIVQCAQMNGVALYCIPVGTSSFLQPLEVSIMEPLKKELKSMVTQLQESSTEPGPVITRSNFASVFREPFNNAMTKHTIRKGFRKTGICPWDPTRIGSDEKTEEEVHNPQTQVTELEAVEVDITEVPEPIRGPDNQIIEMIVTADDIDSEAVVLDQVMEMVARATEPEPEDIQVKKEEQSISSDDLDDFLAEDEDFSETDLESSEAEEELKVVVD
ncbi:uncharacterized protein LOC119732406 [Patiria miniata]|uniref:HTH CENPB-type domain-containing protein n=1 Tax=Patiria miniata TaxID=46514 RepID=A0A914AEP1_PATMI|nr:uncharacterized protein LOC119732406 [Patiria miniata]XP_038061825.1 uncharacterized protein LOC119732406 [Patiria miniata]